jgi:hypothetical protein
MYIYLKIVWDYVKKIVDVKSALAALQYVGKSSRVPFLLVCISLIPTFCLEKSEQDKDIKKLICFFPVLMGFVGILIVSTGEILTSKKLRKKLEAANEALKQANVNTEQSIAHPPFEIINKDHYSRLIREWSEKGEGNLLLYNIELQTFTEDEIEKTWGGLAQLQKIKNVVLLLPPEKIRRWERVVLREREKFFQRSKGNRKFLVCEYSTEGEDNPLRPQNIAFALYRFGQNASDGDFHNQAVVFVLSPPFCERTKGLLSEPDTYWWDYHHVLKFEQDKDLINNLQKIWKENFNKTRVRNVDRVIEDSKPLEPISPEALFDKLGVEPERKRILLACFKPREAKEWYPNLIQENRNEQEFYIEYDNGDKIKGRFRAANNNNVVGKKPAIIWVGGFTERHKNDLPNLFKRVLKEESVNQFYYEVSSSIEYVTLSKYRQDMEEVLRYVNCQNHIILPNKSILIARSINGLIAALVASEKRFLNLLGGVILVAPVFDIIEMIDNYRASRGQKHVRVENCWRCSPGYTAENWEDKKLGWLEFFRYHVSLAVMADIIRHDEDAFSIEAFKNAIGTISHHCPVYVLSHSKDPITNSEKALKILKNAASGSGLIDGRNYKHVQISSNHLPPDQIDKDLYPFAIKDGIASEQRALRNVLQEIGIGTLEKCA